MVTPVISVVSVVIGVVERSCVVTHQAADGHLAAVTAVTGTPEDCAVSVTELEATVGTFGTAVFIPGSSAGAA